MHGAQDAALQGLTFQRRHGAGAIPHEGLAGRAQRPSRVTSRPSTTRADPEETPGPTPVGVGGATERLVHTPTSEAEERLRPETRAQRI